MAVAMSDQPTATGEHPVTHGEVRTLLKWSDLKILGGVIIAIFVAGWLSLQAVDVRASQAATRELTPLSSRLTGLEQRLEIHLQESHEAHTTQSRHLERLEVKIDALLTAQRTGKPPPPIDAGEAP